MVAPKNNSYWKKRNKVGRPKKIESPQVLWEYACDYFHHVTNNPFKKLDFVKGGKNAGTLVELEITRPFTWKGLCDFLFEKGVISDLKNYKANKDGRYEDYAPIITHIGMIIYIQKFEGAAIGIFNANIIARDLGLSNKRTIKNDVKNEQKFYYSKLSEGTLNEIASQSELGSSPDD